MTAIFKILRLTFIAVLAMNVVAVVSAHAQTGTYTADEYPATITGEQVGTDVWTTNAGTISCTHVTYHGELSGPSASLQLTPTYTGCKAFGLFNATIDLNGCKYETHAATTEATHKYNSTVDLNCDPSKRLTVTTSVCRLTYPQQQGFGVETSTKTTGPGTFHRKDVAPTSMFYTVDPPCATASEGEYSNGSFTGESTLSATNEVEETIGISITD